MTVAAGATLAVAAGTTIQGPERDRRRRHAVGRRRWPSMRRPGSPRWPSTPARSPPRRRWSSGAGGLIGLPAGRPGDRRRGEPGRGRDCAAAAWLDLGSGQIGDRRRRDHRRTTCGPTSSPAATAEPGTAPTGITSSGRRRLVSGTRAVGYWWPADGSARVSFAAPGDVDLSGQVNVFDLRGDRRSRARSAPGRPSSGARATSTTTASPTSST